MNPILLPMSDALQMWTIYRYPRDYPRDHVARRFDISRGVVLATDDTLIDSLDALRIHFRTLGMTRLKRDKEDDPVIVETWV
jgi:hypothetical protein